MTEEQCCLVGVDIQLDWIPQCFMERTIPVDTEGKLGMVV